MRAAIYVRISLDRAGKRAGIERQLADCRSLCSTRDWSVVGTYEDNDRSAYNGRERPGYERLVEDVAAGSIDVVVAWHSDRLWRQTLEQQLFLALGRDAGLKLIATPSGDFDPADADDAFMSTMHAAMAQKESADKSRRMKRRQVQKAEQGEFHGGGRAFGHNAKRTKIVEREAELIRDAARRVLTGESVSSIVLEWQSKKIPTTRGGRWRVDALSSLLVQPRIAGLREHRGVVVGRATWPRIIDVPTHERVVALFAARRRAGSRPAGQKHLLTGLLRCHACGASMIANPKADHSPRYVCPARPSGGCGGTSISAVHAECAVRDRVLDHLDDPEFARALEGAQLAHAERDRGVRDAADRLSTDRARLVELGDALADGDLDRVEYRRLADRVRRRIEEAESTLVRQENVGPALALVSQGGQLRHLWDHSLTLGEKRDVVSAVTDHFVVESAPMPRNVFHAERVRPVWRFE